jgi:hypothetical protein
VKLADNYSQFKRKEKGQSLVELALFFPVLLLMLSGLVEFGYMLNGYLNLMDGPREAARFGVDRSPFVGATENDDILFYTNGDPQKPGLSEMAIRTIFPYDLDPTADDIVISVVAVKNGAIFRRYPDDVGVRSTVTGAGNEYSYNGIKKSKFTDAQINTALLAGVPKAGIVIVEMWYSYRQELALPWITPFVPDPIQLYMSSVAPLPAAAPPEPTPTP